MNKELQIIEEAISDVGYWRWWTKSEDIFQIEFGGTQLLFSEPVEKEPPSTVLAI